MVESVSPRQVPGKKDTSVRPVTDWARSAFRNPASSREREGEAQVFLDSLEQRRAEKIEVKGTIDGQKFHTSVKEHAEVPTSRRNPRSLRNRSGRASERNEG